MDSRYIPRDQMSEAEKLSFVLYDVTVPRLYLQTADAANFFGHPTQDNPLAQKEQEQGDMRVSLPIVKMADLYARGCRPWFVKVRETVHMYKDLVAYLKRANEEFDKNPYSGRFTEGFMDNLLKLDNFAQWVFDVAVEHFPNENLEPRGTLASFSRRAPMSRVPLEQIKQQEAQNRQTEHVRVVDNMVERQVARQRSGWH